MEFELTPILMDEIIFAMENQTTASLLDIVKGTVVNPEGEREGEAGDETIDGEISDRFIELPQWGSMDGFRLMEAFVSALHNPTLRDRLSSALASGRGVFRAFKNVIKEFPESEKLWYVFKDREMKKAVYRWYNALRESWGLEGIGEEPEETAELVVTDFQFRPAEPADGETVETLSRSAFMEAYNDLPISLAESLYDRSGASRPGNLSLIAETATRDFAGFIKGEISDLPGGARMLSIVGLAVREEYRGLGIGEELLERFLEIARGEDLYVSVEVPQAARAFSPVIERAGFEAMSTVYLKKP